MIERKVYNESKESVLTDYDLETGYLREDRLFIAHHAATAEVQEVSRLEVIKEYPNGGKDVQTIIDMPYKPARAAYEEFEDIYVFVPYTESELVTNREKAYKAAIVAKIRKRFTLDDELAIARQRDVKPDEWAAYNAYCEQCKAEVKAELGL